MRQPARRRSDFVLRPSVVAAMLLFALGAFWCLETLAKAGFATLDEPRPLRLLSGTGYAVVSGVHALLLVAILCDAFAVRRSPPGLRRAHWAGLAMALVTLSVAQLGAWYAHVPLGTPVSQNAPAQPAPHAPLEGGR